MREVTQDLGENRIVFDDQHHAPRVHDRMAIIFDKWPRDFGGLLGRRFLPWTRRRRRRDHGLRSKRQDQGKGASLSGRAPDPYLATQKLREFPRNRKAQSRAAELSTCRAVSLLKRSEDNLLLAGGNPDAGVFDGECDAPGFVRRHEQPDRAFLRELQRVREQIGQDLLDTLRIRFNRPRAERTYVNAEVELLLRGKQLEAPLEITDETRDGDRLDVEIDLACLDLRQIEDVVDERKQVISSGGNALRDI